MGAADWLAVAGAVWVVVAVAAAVRLGSVLRPRDDEETRQ